MTDEEVSTLKSGELLEIIFDRKLSLKYPNYTTMRFFTAIEIKFDRIWEFDKISCSAIFDGGCVERHIVFASILKVKCKEKDDYEIF